MSGNFFYFMEWPGPWFSRFNLGILYLDLEGAFFLDSRCVRSSLLLLLLFVNRQIDSIFFFCTMLFFFETLEVYPFLFFCTAIDCSNMASSNSIIDSN